MLKPKEMCRITIAGPKSVRSETVSALFGLGILHIEDYVKPSGEEVIDIGTPKSEAAQISETLLKARSIKAHLNIKKPGASGNGKKPVIKDTSKEIERIEGGVVELFDELKDVDDSLAQLKSMESVMGPVSALGLKVEAFTSYNTVSYVLGLMPRKADTSKLKKDIQDITKKSEIFSKEYGGKHVVAVFAEKEKMEEVLARLLKYGFSEIPSQALAGLKGKPRDALKEISRKKDEFAKRKENLKRDIDTFGKRYASFVLENEESYSEKLEIYEAPLRFAETKNAFVVDGWIPAKDYGKLEKEITKATDGRTYIRKSKEKGKAPTALENPKVVRPFEFFMSLYSLPKYTEIDPTFFVFLTFPFFFGFMLGDIGYGLLTLGLFLFLKQKTDSRELKNVLNVMIFASIMTVIFGYIYGEFFGAEHIFGYALNPLFHRLYRAADLLTVAIAIGVAHVNLGLIIGFYNELRAHGIKAAVLEKASWMILQAGAVVYILVNQTAGIGVLLLAVVMLAKGEGVKGILELPSILTNILSYARLMAVGLASAILALVVNDMAGGAFQAGIFGMILGVVILVVGHSINIALGLLSPFIHSLRLHYVEFFLKFYQGGGKRYMPFGAKE